MLRLSSKTSVLPSARAQCSMETNDRNTSTLLSKTLNLRHIASAWFLRENTELDRFVCMTATSDAILQEKSTSALAVDFPWTPVIQPIRARNVPRRLTLSQSDAGLIIVYDNPGRHYSRLETLDSTIKISFNTHLIIFYRDHGLVAFLYTLLVCNSRLVNVWD